MHANNPRAAFAVEKVSTIDDHRRAMNSGNGGDHDDDGRGDNAIVMSQEELVQIQSLVQSGNRNRLNAWLGIVRNSPPPSSPSPSSPAEAKTKKDKGGDDGRVDESISSTLQPSTPKATALLEYFVSKMLPRKHSDDDDDDEMDDTDEIAPTKSSEPNEISLYDAFCALLMVNPYYSTPWMALCEAGLRIHHLPVFRQCEYVSAMEVFLMEQFDRHVASGQDSTSKPSKTNASSDLLGEHGAAFFLNKLAGILMAPLLPGRVGSGKQPVGRSSGVEEGILLHLFSGVLRTICMLGRAWDAELGNNIIQTIYFRPFGPMRTLQWLRLVDESRTLFHAHHLLKFSEILLQQLRDKDDSMSDSLPPQDVAAVISIVLELSQHCPPTGDVNSNETSQNLTRAVVCALEESTVDSNSYSAAEKCLLDFASRPSCPSTFLEHWTGELVEGVKSKVFPRWLSLNLHVLLLGKRPSYGAINDCIVNEGIQDFRLLDYQQAILQTAFGTACDGFNDSDLSVDVLYTSKGSFQDADGHKNDLLSSFGQTFLRALSLGKDGPGLEKDKELISRAFRFIDVSEFLLVQSKQGPRCATAVLAVIASAVTYIDFPSSRRQLVRRMKGHFHAQDESNGLSECCISTIRIILASFADCAIDDDKFFEPLRSLLDGSLPAYVLADLSEGLGSFSEMRVDILIWSKELLVPLYSCSNNQVDIMLNPATQEDVRYGALSLIGLIRVKAWDKICINAWKTLSDLLVFDIPPLLAHHRQWIYAVIEKSLSCEILTTKMSEHFLRALMVRLSLFFYSEGFVALEKTLHSINISSTQGQEERQEVNDIVGLSRLLLFLFRFLSVDGNGSDQRAVLLAEGREAFLRHVLARKHGKKDASQSFSTFWKKQELRGHVDTFSICWAGFLQIQCRCLDACIISRPKPFEVGDIKRHIQIIKAIEQQSLEQNLGDSLSENDAPLWLEATMGPCLNESQGNMHATTTSNRMQASMMEVFLELLWISPLPTRQSSHDTIDPLSRRIIPASGYFITTRGSLNANDGSTGADLSIETLKRVAVPFLATSSDVVRDAICQNCNLPTFLDLVVPVLKFCDTMHHAGLEEDGVSDTEAIGNLWNLYQAIASEKASLRLIEYLESKISQSHLSQSGNVQSTKSDGGAEDDSFLTQLSTDADVDRAVQRIRFSVLRALHTCLGNGSQILHDENGTEMDLIWGILGALAKDLKSGVSGQSGGVTHDMYICFLRSIEECSSTIFRHASQSSFKNTGLLSEVASTLTEILVSFSLHEAVLFKTTFFIATSMLPSMCRDLVRKRLRLGHTSNLPAEKVLVVNAPLISRTFDDSIEILTRWASLREPHLVPWEDIAGSFHLRPDDENQSDQKHTDVNISSLVSIDDSNTTPINEIPRVVHVPSPPNGEKRKMCLPETTDCPRIRFPRKEVWSWTLSCSLLGVEQDWLESKRSIQSIYEPMEVLRDNLSDVSCLSVFFRRRTEELRNSLTQVNRFFQASVGSAKVNKNGLTSPHILGILAINLPSAPRSRLCCTIECISQVLVHSIDCLDLHFAGRDGVSDQPLALLESMSCLAAWLSNGNDSTDSKMGEDFSGGVFTWQSVVSRKLPPGEFTPSRGSHRTEMSRRLSKVSEHIRQLHRSLKSLQTKFRKIVEKRSDDKIFSLSTLSEISGLVLPGYDGGKELLRLMTLKVKEISASMPGEPVEPAFPDFPLPKIGRAREMDSLVEGTEHRVRRPSKRPRLSKTGPGLKKKSEKTRGPTAALGTRNKIVNMFMSLDQEIEDTAKRSATGDAYADLEDFLVEG